MVILGTLVVFMALTLLLLFAGESDGATLVVSQTGGGTHDSIQEAIDASRSDDIIRVYTGHYYENVVVDKRVWIIGNGSSKTTINGWEIGHAMRITADGVTVSRMSFKGGYSNEYHGLVVQSDANVIFENRFYLGWAGLHLDGSRNNVIYENTFDNNNEYGLWLDRSDNNTVSNSVVHDNDEVGIMVSYSGNNTLSFNECYGNDEYGLWLSNSNNNTLRENTIVDHRNTAINLMGSDENIIHSNNLSGNGAKISLSTSHSNQILENAIQSGSNGVKIFYSVRNRIEDNSLYGRISLEYSLRTILTGNRFTSSGLVIEGDSLEHWNSHAIDNNLVNDLPLIYRLNTSTDDIFQTSGQVILVNCTDMIFKGHRITNTSVGIQLAFSENVTITNTTLDNNDENINLQYTNNSKIIKNNLAVSNRYTQATLSIRLVNAHNNTIKHNNILHGIVGIYIEHSNDNNISENTINGISQSGISIYQSDNNSIVSNNIVTNSTISQDYGIRISNSNFNLVIDNSIEAEVTGIYLSYAGGNHFANNKMLGSGFGFSYYKYVNNYNDIQESLAENTFTPNNLLNSEPALIIKDGVDIDIPENISQLFLINCINITVKGLNISNTQFGVLVISSSNITIADCDLSHNDVGLFIAYSHNITAINNTLSHNDDDGLDLYWSHSTIIESNRIDHNHYYGVHLRESHDILLDDNIYNLNRYRGIYIDRSWSNVVSNSTIIENTRDGLSLYRSNGNTIIESHYNTIKNNNCSRNDAGINIDDSNSNVIEGNQYFDNRIGLFLDLSHENTIANNVASDNSQYGIFIYFSNENILRSNTIDSNQEHGMHLYNAHDNLIEMNHAWFNNRSGLKLYYSDRNVISHNGFAANNASNLHLHQSDANTVENNDCSLGDIGIHIRYSDGNTIVNNTLLNNTEALKVEESKRNTILNNTVTAADSGPKVTEPDVGPEDGNRGISSPQPAILLLALAASFATLAFVAGHLREQTLERERQARLEARWLELERQRQEEALTRSMIYQASLKDHARWRPVNGKGGSAGKNGGGSRGGKGGKGDEHDREDTGGHGEA